MKFLTILLAGFLWSQPGAFALGGGEIPIPFTGTNQKVELADGEVYTLAGTVVYAPALNGVGQQAFLMVDLTQHPWLANAKRVASPYYPLEGQDSFWRSYQNVKVKMVCEAHGNIMTLSNGTAAYVLSLEIVSSGSDTGGTAGMPAGGGPIAAPSAPVLITAPTGN